MNRDKREMIKLAGGMKVYVMLILEKHQLKFFLAMFVLVALLSIF